MSAARPKVLVVDDDAGIRETLVQILEWEGYDAVGLVDGQQALDHLRTATVLPALVLLDLMMPRMDGYTFRERQLADPRLAHIPVAVISAAPYLPEKAQQLRVARFLNKPFDLTALLDFVRAVAGPAGAAPPSDRAREAAEPETKGDDRGDR